MRIKYLWTDGQKTNKQGCLLLFTACKQSVKWSNGLSSILEGSGAAIEEVDNVTGLEAFMLAAVEEKSNLEALSGRRKE